MPVARVEVYASGADCVVSQTVADTEPIPHGVVTEWYESGELERFAEYVGGRRHGVEKIWDRSGELLSRTEYRRGAAVKAET